MELRLEGDELERCKICGRPLVVWHRDGTFDLAPKAQVTLAFPLLPQSFGHIPGEQVRGSAVDIRFRCRLRSRLRRSATRGGKS